jgi:hypothetical protein
MFSSVNYHRLQAGGFWCCRHYADLLPLSLWEWDGVRADSDQDAAPLTRSLSPQAGRGNRNFASPEGEGFQPSPRGALKSQYFSFSVSLW